MTGAAAKTREASPQRAAADASSGVVGPPRAPAVIRGLLHAYRTALVPFFGPSCRFEPSCSHYAEQAIALHGFWRGLGLALKRIGRCHPFATPGLDPVPSPQKFSQPARVRG